MFLALSASMFFWSTVVQDPCRILLKCEKSFIFRFKKTLSLWKNHLGITKDCSFKEPLLEFAPGRDPWDNIIGNIAEEEVPIWTCINEKINDRSGRFWTCRDWKSKLNTKVSNKSVPQVFRFHSQLISVFALFNAHSFRERLLLISMNP